MDLVDWFVDQDFIVKIVILLKIYLIRKPLHYISIDITLFTEDVSQNFDIVTTNDVTRFRSY